MSETKLLTAADREHIVEEAVEFAASEKDTVLRDSARALLEYERTMAAMETAVAKARAIIELGDHRLLALDGPCNGLPPDLKLSEWRELYVTLSTGLFATSPAANQAMRDLSEAEAYIAKLRGPLLYFFGTTDPEDIAEQVGMPVRPAPNGDQK